MVTYTLGHCHWPGSNGSYGNFRPCLDVRFTKNVGCMIDRGARYKVYATIHTSQLSTPLRQEQRATRRFLEATPMKEVTFQRARESARGAVSESLSVRYRPRAIARPTAKCVGRAGSRSWWTHRLLQYVIAAASAQDRCTPGARAFAPIRVPF